MEDAATAEISRSQIWQWIHHPKGVLDDGRKVTFELFRQYLKEESEAIRKKPDVDGKLLMAASELLESLVKQKNFAEFLTLPGYEKLN